MQVTYHLWMRLALFLLDWLHGSKAGDSLAFMQSTNMIRVLKDWRYRNLTEDVENHGCHNH